MSTIESTPARRLLLLGGTIAGLALASYGALTGGAQKNNRPLPPGAVARIDEAIILRADYIRALNAVSAGKRNALNTEDKALILQRLIEEELLVQRAMDMGLADQDPALRNALVNAITKDIIAQSRAKPISPVVLRDYYYRNKARFSRPARVFIRAVFFTENNAGTRMHAFDQALQGGMGAQDLIAHFGHDAPPIPEGLVPVQKLKDYIGTTPLRALDELSTGQWSGWIDDNTGFWRLYLVNRTRTRTPELESVRDQVEAAYLDERDDAALRTYLERLKRGSKIFLSPDAPQ